MLKKLSLALLALLLVAGCSKSVVARYTAQDDSGALGLTLYSDKTFLLAPVDKANDKNFLPMTGTYTAKGNDYTLSINTVGKFAMPGVNKGGQDATMSADGKTISWKGITFTKS